MPKTALADLLSWSSLSTNVQSLGEFVYFRLIYAFLSSQIREFGLDLMGRFMAWAGSLGLVLMTLWLMVQGYRIVTGASREPMAAFMLNSGRAVIILSTATSMAFFGTSLHAFLTEDVSRLIHLLVTGDDSDVIETIDEALLLMQLAISSIDAVSVVDADAELTATKARAALMAGFGAAGPPITAGALLLIYQIALALFIGLGPLFILCLMFDQTRGLFQRWLFYGVGTLFSMAVLSFVISLAMKLLILVSGTFWALKALGGLTGLDLTEGLSSQAVQQGGLGLLLTLLILSTPPMVAAFFQGALGQLMHYSAWAGNSALGAGGRPPGSYDTGRGGASGALAGAPGSPPAPEDAPHPGSVRPVPPALAPSETPYFIAHAEQLKLPRVALKGAGGGAGQGAGNQAGGEDFSGRDFSGRVLAAVARDPLPSAGAGR